MIFRGRQAKTITTISYSPAAIRNSALPAIHPPDIPVNEMVNSTSTKPNII